MRLKEIKPGMVIHCKTKEEMEQLSKHIKFLNTVDNIWNYGNDGVNRDCIRINEMGKYEGFCTYDYYANEMRYKITEFSDLILPELTAEETLEWISKHYRDKEWIKCFGKNYCIDGLIKEIGTDNVISKIYEWKYDHKNKEPEIEIVDICRIIEIQKNGYKRCVHEEDIKIYPEQPCGSEKIAVKEILKRYCMEHDGEFIAVHEVVSRVKK